MKVNGTPLSSGEGKRSAAAGPDPEVAAKATRRRREGSLRRLAKKRGPKPSGGKREARKVRKLERENVRLHEELRKARIIIDVQGKVAGLLGVSPRDGKRS